MIMMRRIRGGMMMKITVGDVGNRLRRHDEALVLFLALRVDHALGSAQTVRRLLPERRAELFLSGWAERRELVCLLGAAGAGGIRGQVLALHVLRSPPVDELELALPIGLAFRPALGVERLLAKDGFRNGEHDLLTLRRFDGEGAGCRVRPVLVQVGDALVQVDIVLLSFDRATAVDCFRSGRGLDRGVGNRRLAPQSGRPAVATSNGLFGDQAARLARGRLLPHGRHGGLRALLRRNPYECDVRMCQLASVQHAGAPGQEKLCANRLTGP